MVMTTSVKPFGKIGVLMGGPSAERPISLRSAAAVYESLKNSGYDVVSIDITTDDPQANAALLKSNSIDCAFIALHGKFGEDGQIQKILEDLRIPYTGSGVEASRRAMDKEVSQSLFREAGIVIPEYVVVEKSLFIPDSSRVLDVNFSVPWVVKPSRQGSSIGLSIIEDPGFLPKALDLAFETDDKVIVQQYIKGRELTVAILDDQPLPVIEIVTTKKFFDYEAKYEKGFTDYIVPAKIDHDTAMVVQTAALAAHRALGCSGCSRVDIILDASNAAYVLELNNIPGLTATSLLPKAARCAGIDFNQLCVKLLTLAYEKK
jgi:D-alanine-D-alanine ligase